MIKFIKTSYHFKDLEDETEGMSICIETEGQTLGEITEAFNKFLFSCGYQIIDESDLSEIKDDKE